MTVETVEMRGWAERSACKAECDAGRADRSWWFPERGEPYRRALDICAVCPVREECLAWAVEHGELGIWGGLSERARRRIPRPKDCAECGKRFVIVDRKPGRDPATCSERCARIRHDRQKEEAYLLSGRAGDPGRYKRSGHGIVRYNAGCRCKVCRAAARRKARTWRAAS